MLIDIHISIFLKFFKERMIVRENVAKILLKKGEKFLRKKTFLKGEK
jgi:hypothetical protein